MAILLRWVNMKNCCNLKIVVVRHKKGRKVWSHGENMKIWRITAILLPWATTIFTLLMLMLPYSHHLDKNILLVWRTPRNMWQTSYRYLQSDENCWESGEIFVDSAKNMAEGRGRCDEHMTRRKNVLRKRNEQIVDTADIYIYIYKPSGSSGFFCISH